MYFKGRNLILAVFGILLLPVWVSAAPKLPAENKVQVNSAVVKTEPVKTEPAKTEPAKTINPVILQVQRGTIIDEIVGDVDGDGKDEAILLMGNKVVTNSTLMGDLYVVVKDLKDGKIKAYIRPQNYGGYNSFLTLADVTGDGISDVIITAPVGGSSDTLDLRVLDFSGDGAKEIFTKENNSGINFVGEYLPNYQAQLKFPKFNRNIVVDLAEKKELYNNFNVYNKSGELENSGLKPYIQDFSSAIVVDVDGDGSDELLTKQSIVGPNNMDTLGYVSTVWKYMADSWQEKQISFKINLFVKNNYSSNSNILGPSGYLIRKQNIETDSNVISYPHVSKMGVGLQQGRLNSQIDTFVKKVMSGISTGDQVQIGYELKYVGTKWLSILFTGVKTKDYKNTNVMQAFNFDMETGESISLESILAKQNEFWTMVKKESTKKGCSISKTEVQGFYYDGDSLVLLCKDKEVFAVTKKALEIYVRRDKI